MKGKLSIGVGQYLLPIPAFLWRSQIRARSRRTRASLSFMTEEHHRVRELAVVDLPRSGEPLSPQRIADELTMPLVRVVHILDDLEKHLTFVCRDDDGAVRWAYPVTAETTPHHVTFSSGERLYAA